jgi:hypothetical protein
MSLLEMLKRFRLVVGVVLVVVVLAIVGVTMLSSNNKTGGSSSASSSSSAAAVVSHPFVGSWKEKAAKQSASDLNLVFTTDSYTATGNLVNPQTNTKLGSFVISAKYEITKTEGNMYSVTFSSTTAQVSGVDDLTKKTYEDGILKSAKENPYSQFRLSDDKKEMTEVNKDGTDKTTYVRVS